MEQLKLNHLILSFRDTWSLENEFLGLNLCEHIPPFTYGMLSHREIDVEDEAGQMDIMSILYEKNYERSTPSCTLCTWGIH